MSTGDAHFRVTTETETWLQKQTDLHPVQRETGREGEHGERAAVYSCICFFPETQNTLVGREIHA